MILTALAILAATSGGTLVLFTTAAINSGDIAPGDEAWLVSQIFLGLLLLLIVHNSGILW